MKKIFSISFSIILVVFFIFSCSSKKEGTEATKRQEASIAETDPYYGEFNVEMGENTYASDTADVAGTLKILSHGPVGEARGQAQIKIDFATPLIPLTTLSDSEREEILGHFVLKPAIEGKFRFLGTSSVVFEPEHSLPMATEYKVIVIKGLEDIQGNMLEENFAWEFQTPLPQINIYPRSNSEHVNIDQPVSIHSNISLSIESLKSKIEFYETLSKNPVSYKFLESDRNPPEGADIGMQRVRYEYILQPKDNLKKDTQYMVIINPGVMTARGNRPTITPVSTSFRTFPPFRFLATGFCKECGVKLVTTPYITFTNNLKAETAEEFIAIEPALDKSPFYRSYCGDYSIGIDDAQLEPHTTYTITLNEGLVDIYGQNLENPQQVTFTTGDLTPKMWGPNGYQIITPNIEPTLGIKTVNINSASYKLLSLQPKDILVRDRIDYYYSIKKLISALKTDDKILEISLNDARVGKSYFDLKPYLRGGNYGVVAYSFRSPKVQCYPNPIEFNGLILRTNMGIYTQFHPTVGVIKLNQLTDGQPISGAKIKIYREDDLPRLEKIWDLITNTLEKKMTPCFEGVTDSNGLLMLSAEETSLCTKRKISNKILNEYYPPEADPDDILYDQQRFGFAEPPQLLIVAEKGDDWTFLQTDPYGNPSMWQFGVQTAWEAERPIPQGTIFSEHYLYRPGDIVQMKGISRYRLYGKLLTGEGMNYRIKLRDPNGTEKIIDTVKVNEFGTFHFEIPTRGGQTLGSYQVVAESQDRRLQFYGDFRLAEYRVPEFLVTMNIDKKLALPEEPIELSWEGKYYFGAPMSEAKSSLNITRRRTYFRPPSWDEFSFGIPQYLEDRKVELTGQYLNETINLNHEGIADKTIKVNPDDVPYPLTYLCDVEVEDVSKQTISANKGITLLPDKRLVGLKLSSWIASKNSNIDLSVIVSSPQGEPMTDIPLNVKLIKKEWHSVKTETPDGRFTMERNLVKEVMETKEITSSSEPVQLSFVPKTAGSYFILAELKNRPNSGTAAATSIWVAGEDYVPWEDEGEDKLEIIMDKEEYQVGEEAVAFIKSPFPEAELFFTVSREKIFLQETKRIKGSAYTYRFKVTEDMLPNAFVGAALFRLGEPIVPVEEEIGKHMERIGFSPFKVSLSNKYLKVNVQPDRKKARPAEEVNVDIQVSRSTGQGHRSELTVMVVDEAVLSLTGYSPPDLVKIVYQQRGLSARINDNRPFVITEEQLLQKGTGYGGGVLGDITGPRVRKKFLKVAYYKPDLVTDEKGNASFKLKLPDNLTTWKIMVVAVGEENLFGYGDEELVATQPFILRAVLPRFARIGDNFFSGVAVTNLTEGNGKIKVRAEISGKSIKLKEKPEITGVQVKSGDSRAVLFSFQAERAGESNFKFTAFFDGVYDGKTISESDALEIPLQVQDLTATETVVAVGETQDKFTQKIKIDDTIRRDTGGLNVVLSSTALTNIGEGAKYLVDYPYGCLEQTSSKLLALIQLKFLSDKYGFTLEAIKPVDKVIEANIRKILLLQHSDGGFRFWPTSSSSSCYLSPYVAYLFKRSRELGYDIPEDAVKKLIQYLDKTLRNPCYPLSTWKAEAGYSINILIGLHYLGVKDETYFEEYFNRRNDLSYGAQISLAYLLFQSLNWKKESFTLLGEIKNGVFVTAQTAHFESPRDLPPSWRFMYSPVITTAQGLKLFLEMEPESPYIAKFARYILNARKNGRWRYTYENANAIDGLVEVSLKREAQPPDYTSKVIIAGNEVLKHMFKGYQYKPPEKFIPISNLPQGTSDIEIAKDGRGYLYYSLSYSYRLKGPQVSRKEGFSIKRSVSNSETDKQIVTYADEPPEQIEVKAGDVLNVELEFSVLQTGYHLVIDDPIPAGLEAIDASLKTTSSRYETPSQSRISRGRDDAYGYYGNPINHTELRDDRVALFADAVRPGIYKFRYLLRATTSGVFFWPGAKVSLMYEPEQFGTCAEGFISVVR